METIAQGRIQRQVRPFFTVSVKPERLMTVEVTVAA